MSFIDTIQDAYKRKGYIFFDNNTPYNLNIFGIRSTVRKAGEWDDMIGVVYRDSQLNWQNHLYVATTDSGKFYLRNPLNKNGTAIMIPGQYRGAYKVGLHGRSNILRSYKALEQKAEMRYVRDWNRDDILDISGTPFWANLKTNLHRAHSSKLAEFVGKYSAGCQVIRDPKDLESLLKLCDMSMLCGFPNSFTYTLFNYDDIW